MSDQIKHECGVALIRLLKPLSFYKKKYDVPFYGLEKLYLMMEKQHNRGQDGAGLATVKLDMKPGERYISRLRSKEKQPIQNIFNRVNTQVKYAIKNTPNLLNEPDEIQKKNIYALGEVMLGHLRYGTSGKNSKESLHPFLRQNNWMNRNLILAGNFNMTNLEDQFQNLIALGQHPKEKLDAVTILEKIGHFLDDAVVKLYKKIKKEGYSKIEASSVIEERLNIIKILKKSSKNWDGGYVMAGIIGHGDAFVLRDPSSIRPVYYHKNDEVVVVASERSAIQTVFNAKFEEINELDGGAGIIIKKSGDFSIKQIMKEKIRTACSFERIYFSRGSDREIYFERKKLGALLYEDIDKIIKGDTTNTVFSYIPNTAEVSFLGILEKAQEALNKRKLTLIKSNKTEDKTNVERIINEKIRIEKVIIKDAKLRTFITEDNSRDDMVAHVYDITHGSVKQTDNLIVVDDSIVRGTTLKKSILKMLDRLNIKHIILVSSAPQIRYPDCYGIDMAKIEDLIAFKAVLELHKDYNSYQIVESVYNACKTQEKLEDIEVINQVKKIYVSFSANQISKKIAQILVKESGVRAKVTVLFQSIENLHKACPKNLGDWYFTGEYPTPGGNRVANKAFTNFYEGVNTRAY